MFQSAIYFPTATLHRKTHFYPFVGLHRYQLIARELCFLILLVSKQDGRKISRLSGLVKILL